MICGHRVLTDRPIVVLGKKKPVSSRHNVMSNWNKSVSTQNNFVSYRHKSVSSQHRSVSCRHKTTSIPNGVVPIRHSLVLSCHKLQVKQDKCRLVRNSVALVKPNVHSGGNRIRWTQHSRVWAEDDIVFRGNNPVSAWDSIVLTADNMALSKKSHG